MADLRNLYETIGRLYQQTCELSGKEDENIYIRDREIERLKDELNAAKNGETIWWESWTEVSEENKKLKKEIEYLRKTLEEKETEIASFNHQRIRDIVDARREEERLVMTDNGTDKNGF